MTDKKLIAIVGATGAQGGGLARAILGDPSSEFAVRALTRDPASEKAKALADMGAEIMACDINDKTSVKKAFDGAYGAFCVTNFWEHMSPEKEQTQAKNMAEAAKETGVQHVIWSTLEDMRQWVPLEDDSMPTLMDKYKVPHFDAKGEANKFFTDLNLPVTLLNTSFYWDNLIYFGMGPQKAEDGNFYFTLPMGDKKLPGIAAEDIGKCAYGIFKAGDEYIRKTVSIAGDKITGSEMAASLSKALDKEVRYNAIEPEVYRNFGFPGAEDLGNMFQVKRDHEAEYCAARNLDIVHKIDPEVLSFDDWLDKYKAMIPVKE